MGGMPKWDKFILWTGAICSPLGILACFRIDAISAWDKLGKMNGRQVFLVISLTLLAVGLVLRWLDKRVTPRNVQRKIQHWLHAFGVLHKTHQFEPWHFTYVVWCRGVRIFIGRPKALEGRYIAMEARITAVLPEHKAAYEAMNAPDRAQFYSALALETAKARIALNWRRIDDISVGRWIPITNQLTESEIIESLNEIQMSATVIWNATTLWLGHSTDLAQVSAAEEETETPALPQPRPTKGKKGKKA